MFCCICIPDVDRNDGRLGCDEKRAPNESVSEGSFLVHRYTSFFLSLKYRWRQQLVKPDNNLNDRGLRCDASSSRVCVFIFTLLIFYIYYIYFLGGASTIFVQGTEHDKQHKVLINGTPHDNGTYHRGKFFFFSYLHLNRTMKTAAGITIGAVFFL